MRAMILGLGVAALTFVTPSAAAPSMTVCSYLAPSSLERSVHIGGINDSAGPVERTRGASGLQGVYGDCTYSKGVHLVAVLSFFGFTSASRARREFGAEIDMYDTNGTLPRPIHGPWTSAYEYGSDATFALVGDVVVHLQIGGDHTLKVRTTAAITETLTAQVARRLG